jgi:predicted nucleic acid-binding Zn ribbon protein
LNNSEQQALPVGEVLKKYFGRHGLTRRVAQADIVNQWAELVGPQVAGVTAPQSVDQNGALWVHVKSAAWMQELQLLSPTIIHELAKRGKRIKYIRWKQAPIEDGVPDPAQRTRNPQRGLNG